MRPIINAHYSILDRFSEDAVMELRAAGMTRPEICAVATQWAKDNNMSQYIDPTQVGKTVINDETLGSWIKRTPQRLARWKGMNADYAEAQIDRATVELVNASELPGSVAKAKAIAEHRRFIAAKTDRAVWGEQPAVSVTLNAGDLHLEALKEAMGMKQIAPPEIPEAEIEVVK